MSYFNEFSDFYGWLDTALGFSEKTFLLHVIITLTNMVWIFDLKWVCLCFHKCVSPIAEYLNYHAGLILTFIKDFFTREWCFPSLFFRFFPLFTQCTEYVPLHQPPYGHCCSKEPSKWNYIPNFNVFRLWIVPIASISWVLWCLKYLHELRNCGRVIAIWAVMPIIQPESSS